MSSKKVLENEIRIQTGESPKRGRPFADPLNKIQSMPVFEPERVRPLNTAEIFNLEWMNWDEYALVNKETKFLQFSGSEQYCLDSHAKMGTNHPMYYKLQLCKNPNYKKR